MTDADFKAAKEWINLHKLRQKEMPTSFSDAWDNLIECYLALLEENKAMREALNELSCWSEGESVNGSFDSVHILVLVVRGVST